jgi:UDP-GlcNAc:undecaprenyl-phosphate/decaprenyl-phosphate GlcNAc-1-phosphate transferase
VTLDSWPAGAAVLGSAWAAILAAGLLASPPRRLVITNYAGRRVPAVLGLAMVPAVVLGAVVVALLAPDRTLGASERATLAALVATGLAGLADDLSRGGPRGLRGHLASLWSGRPTTGTLKLAVGVAAGVLLAALIGGGALRIAAATVLIAACVNVWNALDVVPGRAIKWAVLPLGVALVAGWTTAAGLLSGAALGAAVGILPFDLLERGMLGDAGSNSLGLAVGFGLAVVLPEPALILSALVALGLQAAAETVTISRLVEAAPPLRWLDRLGRRP